MLCVNGP